MTNEYYYRCLASWSRHMGMMTQEELSFRAAIADDPRDAVLRLGYVDYLEDSEIINVSVLDALLLQFPTLAFDGFYTREWYGSSLWDASLREFQVERSRLRAASRAVSVVISWLVGKEYIKTPVLSSHHLKTFVEVEMGEYVSNGAFTAAGLLEGYPYRVPSTRAKTINPIFGISKISVRKRIPSLDRNG